MLNIIYKSFLHINSEPVYSLNEKAPNSSPFVLIVCSLFAADSGPVTNITARPENHSGNKTKTCDIQYNLRLMPRPKASSRFGQPGWWT
jgi:hypothetical protein